MLLAIDMSFRYRLEFYPALELLAFIGFWSLAPRMTGRGTAAFAVGTAFSIVAAHAMWLLNMMSPFGPAAKFLGQSSIVDFYAKLMR